MISTAFFPNSLSWLIVELISTGLAMIGGAIVFRGLWLEKKATKEWYESAADLTSSKLQAERGWKWLMVGIAIETLVAGAIAARDGWEIRQIKIYEAMNDPLNRPISDISVIVRFTVNKAEFSELPRYGGPAAAEAWLMEPPGTNVTIGRQYLNYWYRAGMTELPILTTDHSISFADGKGARIYIMQFHLGEWVEGLSIEAKAHPVKELENVNVLRVDAKYLPHDLEILDGMAKMVVNDTVVKIFKIPRQKAHLDNDTGIDTYSNTTPFAIFAFPASSSNVFIGHWR